MKVSEELAGVAGASGDTARKPFGVSMLLLAVAASSAETNQV